MPTATNGAVVLAVGDRMRISVECIRELANQPDFTSAVVRVQKICLENDGTKTLWMGRLEDR